MERNEVLKKAIEQNCNIQFIVKSNLLNSIDALERVQNSTAKAYLKSLIQDVIIASWKDTNGTNLKAVVKEVNLLANKGAENGTRY